MTLDTKSFLRMSTTSPFNILRWSPKMHVLPSLCIYLTSSCNYDCIMCESRRSNKTPRHHMELDVIERLIKDCSRLRIKPRFHFSGLGEPLVYKNVKRVMELCNQYKIHWSITTNGFALHNHIENLVENNCSGINLSVHGIEDVHNTIVGTANAFKKVQGAVQALEIEKRRKGAKKPRVAINCVITNHNVLQLQEIYEEFEEWPVSSMTFQHVSFSKEECIDKVDFSITDEEKLNSLVSFMDSIKQKANVPVHFFPAIAKKDIASYYKDPEFPSKIQCALPWLSLRVYPSGKVKMCEIDFGDISSMSITDVMNSDAAVNFRSMVSKGKFNGDICFRCCHRAYSS